MSEDLAEIKADQGTESLGKSAYFAAQKGDFSSQGYRSSVFVMLGLVAIIFAAMFFSGNPNRPSTRGEGLPPPQVSPDTQGLNPRLLTDRDLINLVPRPKVERSYLGKIKVVSLRGTGQIPTGAEMRAMLASGATDGPVKARLTAPLVVDGERILPENAVLYGRGKSADERLFVEFKRVILSGGESFPIKALAFDINDRILGLKGAIVGVRTKKMAGAIAFGMMGGMADGLQNSSGSIFGNQRKSTRDAALSGASKAALDQSQLYIDEMKKAPNIIEVKSGTEILVIADDPKPEVQNEK